MSELQQRVERLILRLDRMGMRVEQAVHDAVAALADGDVEAGRGVADGDVAVDREEVEIEQECIRLLALYQPAAIDLRTICTVIKVNSELERIADLAASIGKRVRHTVAHGVEVSSQPLFLELRRRALAVLGRTVRALGACDADTARAVIEEDRAVDEAYGRLVRATLDVEAARVGGAESAMIVFQLAKALERIGDHCTNIAEDVIFLRTGDIVRHPGAFETPPNPAG